MHENRNVTNVETIVPDGVFIYSQTDLRGVITAANEAFCQLSGYTVAEMIGKPHSIVRHPDMPKEAFADLWRAMKDGRPWQGVVKNRRRDGGYYWVIANASPVRENGEIIGYQSLRYKPSRELIRACEAAYEKIRAGNSGLYVEDGLALPVRSSLAKFWSQPEFQLNTALGMAVLASGFGLIESLLGAPGGAARVQTLLCALTMTGAIYGMVRSVPAVRRHKSDVESYLDAVLCSGDLTVSGTLQHQVAHSSIARKLLQLTNWTRTTVLCIQDAVYPVRQNTQKIHVAISEIEQAAKSQNLATASVAAASSELDLTIREVSGYLKNTELVVSESGQRAEDGAEVSLKATDRIQSLAEAIRSASIEVEALGTSTAEVGVIAGVIREIANQTNLLALNASIEAARAGEAGRGFAVVANEVRRLADRTSEATARIDALIETIQGDSERAIGGMRTGAAKMEEGVALVQQAHTALEEINNRMGVAVSKVSEISVASSQQTEAMNEISVNITHVAAMSEQNVSVVHSTYEQIDAMTPLVERVSRAVAQYNV